MIVTFKQKDLEFRIISTSLKILSFLQPGDFFQGAQEQVRNSCGEGVISFEAIESLLYTLRFI